MVNIRTILILAVLATLVVATSAGLVDKVTDKVADKVEDKIEDKAEDAIKDWIWKKIKEMLPFVSRI